MVAKYLPHGGHALVALCTIGLLLAHIGYSQSGIPSFRAPQYPPSVRGGSQDQPLEAAWHDRTQ